MRHLKTNVEGLYLSVMQVGLGFDNIHLIQNNDREQFWSSQTQGCGSGRPQVYKCYVDDCRNTDNAWVMNTVLHIHLDRDSPILNDINTMDIDSLQWQEVSQKTQVSSQQREYLKKVAELHKIRF